MQEPDPVLTVPHQLERRRRRRPVAINVTVPLSVLLGLSDAPAEIETVTGSEPLTAAVARALAFFDDATWRRLVTDPESGTVPDVGRTRYRPPAGLVDHIAFRDKTSRFPTASTPASSCEIDHTIDYSDGGATCDRNLNLLDSSNHTDKTLHPWHLEQPEPGYFRWTSPAGLVHVVEPDPPDTINPDPLTLDHATADTWTVDTPTTRQTDDTETDAGATDGPPGDQLDEDVPPF